MKHFKISASAKALFGGVAIEAGSKKGAEEIFRKKCKSGAIIPQFVFDALEIKEMHSSKPAGEKKRDAGALSSGTLPAEIWDNAGKYDYYARLGYEVLKAHPSKPLYLYSRKEKMVEEYIKRLENMTADECIEAYCPKGAPGINDKNKIREILINSVIDDAKNYVRNFGKEFNERQFRKNAERAISRMPKAIDKIIASGKKKKTIGDFLKKQSIKPPELFLEGIRKKFGKRKDRK